MRKRINAEELDYLCELRQDGKSHKDYNTATGRTNYLITMSQQEWHIVNSRRAKNERACDVDKRVIERKRELDSKKQDNLVKQERDFLLKKTEELESILELRRETESVEIYELKPIEKSGGKETVSISLFSDLHCDEVVLPESVMGKNEYNPEVAKKRANNYFINLVKLISHHQKNYTIKRHIIGMIGDIIGGFIHEELRQTNSMTPLQAIAFAKSVILSGFKYLQDNLEVDSIDVVCIVGNHGRTTDKLPFSNLTETSYEYFMYQDLEYMCKMMGLTKFNFIIPKASMAIVTIFGKNYGFVHGNGFKFMGGIGGLYIPLLKYYARLNATFNIERLFFGHYHTTIDIKQAVGNGSFKGYDAYAMGKALDFEPPQQSLVLLNEKRGFTNFQAIYLD